MKISKRTATILKNFQGINESIYLAEGSVLATQNPAKGVNFFARAKVEEDFPKSVALYKLANFLGILSIMPDAELKFGEKAVTVSNGSKSFKVVYAAPELIHYPAPGKKVVFPDVLAKFDVTKETFDSLSKASSLMGLDTIAFVSNGGEEKIIVYEKSNPTSDTFEIAMTSGKKSGDYRVLLSAEKFKKIMSGDYVVSVSEAGVRFEGIDVEYCVASEIE